MTLQNNDAYYYEYRISEYLKDGYARADVCHALKKSFILLQRKDLRPQRKTILVLYFRAEGRNDRPIEGQQHRNAEQAEQEIAQYLYGYAEDGFRLFLKSSFFNSRVRHTVLSSFATRWNRKVTIMITANKIMLIAVPKPPRKRVNPIS